jgi:hypothetical protein
MPLDFDVLCPLIEQAIDRLAIAYRRTPGLFLTEEDLRSGLIRRLQRLRGLGTPLPSQDRPIRAVPVHAQLPWYDEDWKLTIFPDITIFEPEHLSILHGYDSPLLSPSHDAVSNRRRSCTQPRLVIDPFVGSGSCCTFPRDSGGLRSPRWPPLPSKGFEFGGKAITLELKFARRGAKNGLMGLKADFRKVRRLFGILDSRNQGHHIFSYIVVFDKYRQSSSERALTTFLATHGRGNRHRIIYKPGSLTRRMRWYVPRQYTEVTRPGAA